jgi:hypothetical protein
VARRSQSSAKLKLIALAAVYGPAAEEWLEARKSHTKQGDFVMTALPTMVELTGAQLDAVAAGHAGHGLIHADVDVRNVLNNNTVEILSRNNNNDFLNNNNVAVGLLALITQHQ